MEDIIDIVRFGNKVTECTVIEEVFPGSLFKDVYCASQSCCLHALDKQRPGWRKSLKRLCMLTLKPALRCSTVFSVSNLTNCLSSSLSKKSGKLCSIASKFILSTVLSVALLIANIAAAARFPGTTAALRVFGREVPAIVSGSAA